MNRRGYNLKPSNPRPVISCFRSDRSLLRPWAIWTAKSMSMVRKAYRTPDADCNDNIIGYQLSCNHSPDTTVAGVYIALYHGRGNLRDSEPAGRVVRPKDRSTGKCEHRIGHPDGLGMVSCRHCTQHCRRTSRALWSQRLEDFDMAGICQCRHGTAGFPAA